jgi:hypothetical protein
MEFRFRETGVRIPVLASVPRNGAQNPGNGRWFRGTRTRKWISRVSFAERDRVSTERRPISWERPLENKYSPSILRNGSKSAETDVRIARTETRKADTSGHFLETELRFQGTGNSFQGTALSYVGPDIHQARRVVRVEFTAAAGFAESAGFLFAWFRLLQVKTCCQSSSRINDLRRLEFASIDLPPLNNLALRSTHTLYVGDFQ